MKETRNVLQRVMILEHHVPTMLLVRNPARALRVAQRAISMRLVPLMPSATVDLVRMKGRVKTTRTQKVPAQTMGHVTRVRVSAPAQSQVMPVPGRMVIVRMPLAAVVNFLVPDVVGTACGKRHLARTATMGISPVGTAVRRSA